MSEPTLVPVQTASADPVIEAMKAGRKSPAVLKARLASLRSEMPSGPIFAVEGIEDKLVYFQWTHRVRPSLSYEPFPCGGKRYVFQLFRALQRDLSDLSKDVFFFVDRDFDDWAGHTPSQAIFMTDRYSTENYLVDHQVLDAILRDELHCDGSPNARESIISCFQATYRQFLNITSELNFLIFCAKRLGIPLAGGGAPEKFGDVAEVSLSCVAKGKLSARDLVNLEREPTLEELMSIASDFGEMDAASRYRGKYALQFFIKWLQLVSDERVELRTAMFRGLGKVTKVRGGDASLTALASRSPMPDGFEHFINSM